MRSFLFVLCTAGLVMTASAAENAAALDTSGLQEMLDSLGLSKNDLESKVRSTLMFGGSSPVSFSGEARLKVQYHNFSDSSAPYVQRDKSYLQSNWDGNESFVRIGMVARAGRNTVLWSKIGFQHTLPGFHMNRSKNKNKDDAVNYPHDKLDESLNIHEDMSAGIAIRTVPASFWLKLGAVHWVEASPLSIWKSQPRTFAWEYLPFEVEQPIARYFEYNIAKGEKAGRAAWNKKAFQGINFESIKLPGDLYFNFVYGNYERYDNFEREYGDLGATLGYSGELTNAKSKGIGDPFRKVFHTRLAATELINKLTPGFNFLKFKYDEGILNSNEFVRAFKNYETSPDAEKRTIIYAERVGKLKPGTVLFFKEPWVASADLKGPINDKLNLHMDFALSRIDSTYFTFVDDTLKDDITAVKSTGSSDVRPAFYAHIENKYLLPLNIDIAVISKGFYSPLSFATPVDGFFPFGANLVGSGKFIGRGEASPYTQNMAGINLKYVPELSGYGHLRIGYGQHFQLKAAQDVLYFPYRLNGQDLFTFFHSSYNRWGNDPIDLTLTKGKYKNRIGDESYAYYNPKNSINADPVGFTAGALRSDFLAMFESFVPYQNEFEANANLANKRVRDTYGTGDQRDGSFKYVYTADSVNKIKDSVYDMNAFVPHHQKFTFNFDVDYAYDLSKIFGYSRDLFFSVYAALNGVSTSFKPIAFNCGSDEMLLWGTYVRFEPAIALTNKFYLLGLAGFENWTSNKAYTEVSSKVAKNTPIDYRDYAIGIGFDWDMLSRVGLHGRFKYMEHNDIQIPENNYKTPVVSAEIKMWF